MPISQVVINAKMMRRTVAAMMPTRIARLRCSFGRPAAARPMTMALSPARTMSISSTCPNASQALASPLKRCEMSATICAQMPVGAAAAEDKKVRSIEQA